MDEGVSTTGIPKARVFMTLFNHAKGQGLGLLQHKRRLMDEEEAARVIEETRKAHHRGKIYFDYHEGRVMKVDLTDDSKFDPWLYDRDNGQGAAQAAIDRLRTQQKEI